MAQKGKYAYFPAEEYKQRHEKASQLMDEYELDALFLLQAENLLYFSGYTSFLKKSKHRPYVLFLPKGEDPVLVLPRLQLGDAEGFSHVEDIRLWSSNYVEFYVETFKDLGLDDKRVGIEIGQDTHLSMALLEFERMRSMLPDVTWEDCTGLIFDCRKIKSPREITYMRRASEIASKAVGFAWSELRVGIPEREIVANIGKTYLDEGADELGSIIIRSTPEDLYMRNKMPSDRVLVKGDIVSCDTGCCYRGYWSDMMRAASIGEPSKEMADGFAAAAMINTAVREAVRPGMEIDELDQVRARVIEENNFGTWLPSIGHTIGTTVHELPRIAGGVHEVLQPGMVFCVEPGVHFPPYVFNIEDVVLVTEEGSETLTTYPREIYIAEK